MSLIFATQLTAVATAVLAVFAIVTAFYARRGLTNNGTASGVNGLKTTGLPQLAALISKEPVFLARPGPCHVLARTASMSRERQLARDTGLAGVITRLGPGGRFLTSRRCFTGEYL